MAEAKKLLDEAGRKAWHQIHVLVQHQRIPQEDGYVCGFEWKTKLGIILETEAMEFKVLAKKAP